MELKNKKHYPTPINKRFVEFLNFLNTEKKIQKNVIAEGFGLSRSKFSTLLSYGQHASPELISKAIEIYNVNPYYILLGDGNMFEEKVTGVVNEERTKYGIAMEELLQTQRKLIKSLEAQVESLASQKKPTQSLR